MTEREHNLYMQGVTMGAIHAIFDRIGHKSPDELSRFIGAYLRVFKNYYELDHQFPMEDLGRNAFAAGREAMMAWRKYAKQQQHQSTKPAPVPVRTRRTRS